MTQQEHSIALRFDLVRRRVWMGGQPMWVVKDPLSQDFFYFTDQEWEILRLADGSRSLDDILQVCRERFANQVLDPESLARFFAEARGRGLVIVEGLTRPQRPQQRSARRWWSNPLAVRLPGIHPDPALSWLLPRVRFLFGPIAAGVALVSIMLAVMLVIQDFDTFVQHASIAASRLSSGRGLWMLLIVVSATKIIHELAHALSCQHFGGRCREIGIMFLVGVPCLYCDVSDAWLLERRWKRVLVSAAGMLAELVLASVATFAWAWSTDGSVRDLCVTVMVVCSVTTVLFNGNPLLRYDGYFILSDLVAIPNLAAESAALLRGWLRRFVWATPMPPISPPARRRIVFLAIYGVLSGLYRTAIYFLILWMLYRLADQRGLGGPAGGLLLIAVTLFVFRLLKSILSPPSTTRLRSLSAQRRPIAVTSVAIACLAIILLTPMPRRVVAPMSIQPAGAQVVFASSEGVLAESLPNLSEVEAGESIAVLQNPTIDLELAALKTECARLSTELESLRQRRVASPDVSTRIPLIEKSLQEAHKRRMLKQRLASQLNLTAPVSGMVFPPPRRIDRSDDDRQARFWVGTPLEPANRGAWLTEGTVLCVVGHTTAREAIVLLRQQDIELIMPGQKVSLLLADHPKGGVRGRVVDVAVTPTPQIPGELERVGLMPVPPANSPAPPYYRVRVALDDRSISLPVRLTGQAKISVASASLLSRLSRFLRDTFS